MAGGRKKQKTTAQGSSAGAGSSSGLLPRKWEQLSSIEEGDPRLFRQDWEWAKYRDSQNATVWDNEKNKPLSRYNDRKLEAKLWRWKMVTKVSTSILERVLCERVVNVEEFKQIGITQMFERLGWERVLDWCEDNTSRIYLSEVCEWLSTLRFVDKDKHPSEWRLVGKTTRGTMTMSFESINCIARFDSLGVPAYDYPNMEKFLDSHMNETDPDQMTTVLLPYHDGGEAKRKHMSIEGKILHGISVENILVRFGDRGSVKAGDFRVVHSLIYGTPALSWRHIVMMNTWNTREASQRRFIPYARLISAMIVQQNCLPSNSLWVTKPLEEFDQASIRKNWGIYVELHGSDYVVTDKLGHRYDFPDPNPQGAGGDEEMMEEEEEEEAGPSGPRQPRRRYMRPHRELNADVANFVKQRRVPTYGNFTRGEQANYDNISACIGEGQEYNRRREDWEGVHGTYSHEQWDSQAAYRERMEKYMEDQRAQMERLVQAQEEERARRRAYEEQEAARINEARELERRRWSALALSHEMAINNAKVLHDQERHQRDLLAGLPYAEHSGWTNYPDIPHPLGPNDPTPHWPEAVASSFVPIPYQPPPQQGEQSPLDNLRDMWESLTGYPYQPNPPMDPNERYQR